MSDQADPAEPADAAPPQRVSPISFPAEEPSLPKAAEDEPSIVRDAFRECGFALGAEMRWIVDSLRLQRKIVEQSYPSRFRNHRYASALLLWSRVYTTAIDLLRLTAGASYPACPPLVRASLDWLGAEQAVVGQEQAEFLDWLGHAFEPDRDQGAIAVGMGQYMAGQQIAMSEELATVYRAASELARPHFGVSALLTAPESSRQKLTLHWGDRSFHLGWAQLLFGWQIVILERQLRFAVGRGLFGVEAEDRERFHELSRQAAAITGAPDRCRAEWLEQDGQRRLLIHNSRRQPGGAPKRLLL